MQTSLPLAALSSCAATAPQLRREPAHVHGAGTALAHVHGAGIDPARAHGVGTAPAYDCRRACAGTLSYTHFIPHELATPYTCPACNKQAQISPEHQESTNRL